MTALVLLTVALGGLSQRITGMGFALVSSPFLVLLLGPFSGVLIVNACGAVSALIITIRLWHDVDWHKYVRLVVPAFVGILPGSWLAATLPGPILQISIGLLLNIAMLTSVVLARTSYTATGTASRTVAGFTSGLMNTAAGIGGPAISIYAVTSRWGQRSFAATIQPYFASIGLVSLITKLILHPSGWPRLQWWEFCCLALALVVGLAVGELTSSRVRQRPARAAVIMIAFAGATIAVANGVAHL